MRIALPNGLESFFAGKEFRPRVVPTVATVAFVALAVVLGNWQRHRAAEKDALAAELAAAEKAPPVGLPARDEDALALRFRTVRASGDYDASRQILIDNKLRKGRPGFDVVTPLRLAGSGRYVLVNRGWVAQGASRRDLPLVPPPAGVVTVVGRVSLPSKRYLELARDHVPGPLWENLDVQRVAAATGLDLLPVVVEESDGAGAPDALLRDRPPPDLGSAQHVSYMLQWYSFAALAIALWLGLNWRAREGGHGR
ncbi:MAG TPA: SURF1 family protein [Casimicrobiaceae bacterium]|nr:SURF1 family protein [Casimicrobiaceae bacterium]